MKRNLQLGELLRAADRCTVHIATIAPCSKLLYRKRSSHTVAPQPPLTNPSATCKSSLRAVQIAHHLSTHPQVAAMSGLPMSERGFHPTAPGSYGVRKLGAPNTLEHRIYIEKDGIPVSPFHDIPLYANEQRTVLNMIVEIPRWTNAKVEVSRSRSFVIFDPNPMLMGTLGPL